MAQSSSLSELTNVQQLFQSLSDTVQARGPQLLANLLAAGAIFIVGGYGARLATRVLEKILERARLDETLGKFVCRIAHSLFLIVVALSGLERLGINTTSVAAILAAAGLAVGMALQGSLSNFAAGVMMILFRPFKVGDLIEVAGTRGIVEEVHVFNTLLRTPDNVQVIIPNSSVTAANISNYSRKPMRRIDLVVSCAYKDDLRAVKQFLTELITSDPRVLKDPQPVVMVAELAAHSVDFFVRPWVATPDYFVVRSDLIEGIKLGFDERGFQIPFPQRDVHVHTHVTDEGEAARAAAASEKGAERVPFPSAGSFVQPRRVA